MMGVQSRILGMCTNYTTENKRMFFEAGANACIEKPIDPESLEEAIDYLRNLWSNCPPKAGLFNIMSYFMLDYDPLN